MMHSSGLTSCWRCLCREAAVYLFIDEALIISVYSDSLPVRPHWPSDYYVWNFGEWKLFTWAKRVFRERFFSGQHLGLGLHGTWSKKIRQIGLQCDCCCGSHRVDSCARQRPRSTATVESWVCKIAALESFQLGMARALSCTSHYPLKLLPFLLIRLQLNPSAEANLVIQVLCKWNASTSAEHVEHLVSERSKVQTRGKRTVILDVDCQAAEHTTLKQCSWCSLWAGCGSCWHVVAVSVLWLFFLSFSVPQFND